MSTTTVDVVAERTAAMQRRARQEAETRLRHRALRVLQLLWNGTEQQLKERIHDLYPGMGRDDVHQLLEITLRVQQTERVNLVDSASPSTQCPNLRPGSRPKINPLAASSSTPPPACESSESAADPTPTTSEPKAIMPITEADPISRESGEDHTVADSATATTATESSSPAEETGPHRKTKRSVKEGRRIMDVIRAELQTRPNLTASEVRDLVSKKLGISLSGKDSSYYRHEARRKAHKGNAPRNPPSRSAAEELASMPLPPPVPVEQWKPGRSDTGGRELVQLGAAEIELLRFVGVSEETVAEAVRLANFVNSLPASAP